MKEILRRLREYRALREIRRANRDRFFSSPQQEFYGAVNKVISNGWYLEEDSSDEIVLRYLDFLVDLVVEDIRTTLAAEMIYEKRIRVSGERKAPYFPFNSWCPYTEGTVSIEGNTVIADVELCTRLTHSVWSVSERGFHPEEGNYRGVYYPELRMIVVSEGSHHAFVAGQYGLAGDIKANVFSLEELFPIVHTDGNYWYDDRSHERKGEVGDIRMAILFEIARIKSHVARGGHIKGYRSNIGGVC